MTRRKLDDRPLHRFLSFALISGIAACGGGTAPTAPATPAPAPTPTPMPTPTPNPYATACGVPLPSFDDSYGYGIKVQLEPTLNKKILNASPILKNPTYCNAAGLTGFTICNTRTLRQLPFRDLRHGTAGPELVPGRRTERHARALRRGRDGLQAEAGEPVPAGHPCARHVRRVRGQGLTRNVRRLHSQPGGVGDHPQEPVRAVHAGL